MLIGTGGIGLILGLCAVVAIILRAVTHEGSAWRGACAAGLIGSGLAMSLSGPGLWQPWWIAALAVAAIGIAGAVPVATGGASLGSIFDAARDAEAEADDEDEQDDGLYHFDDDDDYDDYDDDDEDNEWDVDDSREHEGGETSRRSDVEEKRE